MEHQQTGRGKKGELKLSVSPEDCSGISRELMKLCSWVDSGSGAGQGGVAFCGSWGHKESDTTERLN